MKLVNLASETVKVVNKTLSTVGESMQSFAVAVDTAAAALDAMRPKPPVVRFLKETESKVRYGPFDKGWSESRSSGSARRRWRRLRRKVEDGETLRGREWSAFVDRFCLPNDPLGYVEESALD